MNIQTFRIFIAINHYGKLTEAAKYLNITQSALSRTVHQLEKEIGAPLFNHQGNRITLNRNGVRFLEMSKAVIAEYDSCIKEIREENGFLDRSIIISISSAGVSIPAIIHGFRKIHPETWFSLRSHKNDKDDSDVQFTFFCTIDSIDDPDSVFLAEEELYLTVGKSNPIASQQSVALSELSSKHFLFADSNNDMQRIQMHYCRLAGFAPELDNIVDKQVIMIMLLELDEGITMLPKMNSPRLAQIPIHDIHCTRKIYLRKNTQIYETRLAKEFEKYCIEYFRKRT